MHTNATVVVSGEFTSFVHKVCTTVHKEFHGSIFKWHTVHIHEIVRYT